VRPPAYAAREAETPIVAGLRQVAVLEGSAVEPRLKSTNKPLRRATIVIGDDSYELQADDAARLTWRLPIAGTPFADVKEPLQYVLQVADDDGLSLEQPIRGSIRLKSDRRPRIAWKMPGRHERVLPEANVRIDYVAGDDFGLSQLVAHLHVSRKDDEDPSERMTGESREFVVVPAGPESPTEIRGSYVLALEPLQLAPGDELTLTFEAFDFRGDLPPQSSLSDALTLKITDLHGFLDTILKADEKSAEEIDAIIRRELGIGETR
jgi:hypothetical protein